ncbi:MAG TPA: glycosyltransferase family 2 protein [Candidatus Bathyarchaeia archaeon]|jgi:glycosyltransferase involved in cell wall biosynthesis|nr:glycosyltransferase family 2 protein [Candidatus Bathyarchaeia archaeon]
MASFCEISIVIPVFNEAETLAEMLSRIRALHLPRSEVIVVDDGSTDHSADVAMAEGVNVIRHPYNIGNGAAIKSGIRAARGRLLVLIDGDGQHQPQDITKLLAESNNYHMVVGARAKGSKLRFHRYAANVLYNLLASYVTRFKVKDLTSGFRVLSRLDALRFINLLPNTFSYPTTLTLAFLRSGLTVKYIPIQTLYRAGQSKISLVADGIRFLLIITKIATLFSPFRVFLPVSIFFFLGGMTNYVYTFVTEHRFTNMSVFLLTTAVIVFMLGLISEQIALLRMERHESMPQRFSERDD